MRFEDECLLNVLKSAFPLFSFAQAWCGSGRKVASNMYPDAKMPVTSSVPEILAMDINGSPGPEALPVVVNYTAGYLFHGHFACSAD
jgi:hypothetical protein